ncbi:MAG: tetratricopeptide repeat protein [Planctomycetota bacterium]|nr:tetratricopeptide repeat protein [Planctomycetota bacterium]
MKRYEEALQAHERAIEIDPDHAGAHTNRGLVLQYLDRHEEALAANDRALEIDPDSAVAYYNRGFVLRSLGRHEKVLEAWERSLALDSDQADVWNDKGLSLANLGRYPEALAAYSRALEIDPKYAFAHHNRGNTLLALHKLGEAVKSYTEAIRLAPEDPTPYFSRGNAYRDLHEFEKARADYVKAISFDENFEAAWTNLGRMLLLNLHEPRKALPALQTAVALSPDAVTHHNLGLVYTALDRYEDAVAEFGLGLALEPRDMWLSINIKQGVALVLGREYKDALAAFDSALRIEERNFSARWWRGFVLRQMQRYDDARKKYGNLAADSPKTADAHSEHGRALAELGRFPEAAVALARAKEIAAEDPWVLWAQWSILTRQGKHAEAVPVAHKLVGAGMREDDLDSALCAVMLVSSLRAAGQATEAQRVATTHAKGTPRRCRRLAFAYLCAAAGKRDEATRLLESWDLPWQPEDLYDRARVHAVLGQRKEALSWLGRAVEKGLSRSANAAPDAELASFKIPATVR